MALGRSGTAHRRYPVRTVVVLIVDLLAGYCAAESLRSAPALGVPAAAASRLTLGATPLPSQPG